MILKLQSQNIHPIYMNIVSKDFHFYNHNTSFFMKSDSILSAQALQVFFLHRMSHNGFVISRKRKIAQASKIYRVYW